jgi:outer membrane cobalamin receptor
MNLKLLLILKTMMLAITLASFPLIAFSADYMGEVPRIRGKIIDRQSGESLIGATVYILETQMGTASDIDGNFIVKLSKGNYTLRVSFIGYQSIDKKIVVDRDLDLTIYLEKDTHELESVVVTAERADQNVTRAEMSVEKLKINTIRQIPALMGEVDIIKAIQLLPGVQATSDGSSSFSVRGGNFDQNLILIDESPVYNASHLMGFFSVFNNDVVKDVELYKGDIPAAYGGRLSSLLKVDIAEGNQGKWGARGGIGTISSRLAIDGPIGKKVSLMMAGRRSYTELYIPALAKNNEDMKGAGLYFYDVNGKLKIRANNRNSFEISGYKGWDEFKAQGASFGFGNTNASSAWTHSFSEDLISKTTLIYSEYKYKLSSSFTEANSILWTARIRDLGFKYDNTYKLDEDNTIKFGFSGTHHKFFPGLIEPTNESSIFNEYELATNSAIEWGVYGQNIQKIGDKLTLKYGLRFSIFQSIGPGTVYKYNDDHEAIDSAVYRTNKVYNVYQGIEPRLGLIYQLNSTSSVKASYSRTRQYLQMASNSTSGMPLDIWFAANPNIEPQIADLATVGYFRNFWFDQIETSVEVYYKNMQNTIDFRDKANLYLNPHLDGELRIGKSRAYGAEFYVKFNFEKLSGWVSYTLSKAIREIPEINGGKAYNAPYDKPHNINVVLNYELNKRWSVSANWIFASGTPMTAPVGRYPYDGGVFSVYSDRNSYRMPAYHRLDLGATLQCRNNDKHRWKGEWNFSIYNAYAHHNAWTVNFIADENNPNKTNCQMVYLFSFIPSITYNFKF